MIWTPEYPVESKQMCHGNWHRNFFKTSIPVQKR